MIRSVQPLLPRSRLVLASSQPTLQRLWYRGDSGDGERNLSDKEEALLQVAIPKAEMIMERHVRLPQLQDIPVSSLGTQSADADLELDVRRKRLVYRSKQRGWLEVDLLLGTWAHENVPLLSHTELDDFEAFVNMETIDIYNIVTLRTDLPEELKTTHGNSVVERIQAWARDSPLGKADPDTYKTVKTEKNLI
uniref:Succinate dehydrogenase assembly factor 2, mitochondrial n=1 Tax=Cyclophora tenuis TaxID=216820 RepID=A0A7S1DBR3_CYCTE|mmetsp:Transcript_8394/g.14342  ORF Transcript_8394/g.14342 Transcript_8394/m.14342 type:complete len:193 (+) Transcript_8394:30-608(+)